MDLKRLSVLSSGEVGADLNPSWQAVFRLQEACIHGTSRNAGIIRGMPWHETPIGPIAGWDSSLVSALNLLLGARFPMFLTWGAENRLFYNDAFESVVAGKWNCLGRSFHSVFPETWPQLGPILERAMQGESIYLEDFHVFLVRNSVLADSWWSFSYSPIMKASGEVGGVLGVVHETTRRLLAEQSLYSREAALRAVTDTAPALLWRSDPDGRLTWGNQQLRTYLGAAEQQEILWERYVHPHDNVRAQQCYAHCMATGEAFECQERLRGATGEYRWFLVRAQQVWDTDGCLLAWCGSAVDIDDWRRAAEGSSSRNDLVSEFRDAETGLMWVADVSTRRLEGLNPRFRSSWALPTAGDGIVWEDWMRIVNPDDRAVMAGGFDRVARLGETLQGRFRLTAPDGSMRWFHASAFPMPDDEGVIRRIGGLLVEITRNADPRVYLVDASGDAETRHALLREGFKVRSFTSMDAFCKVADDLLPGVVVIAADGEIEPLVAAMGSLKLNSGRMPWIAVGAFEDRLSDVVQLMKHGAANVLTAGNPVGNLVAAVHSAQPTANLADVQPKPHSDARQKLSEISRREREVLDGLVAGQTNKMIAQSLSLSPRTIETYRAQLMDRLGVKTLAELIRLAADARAHEGS